MGSWEPIIKCCKRLLNNLLTEPMYFEEYVTTFAKVEALLNSRPYLELSNDAKDSIDLLCPAHFLVGGTMFTPPSILPYDDNNQVNNIRCRWEKINAIILLFWKR